MSSDSSISNCLLTLRSLKRQFENESGKYPLLSHLLVSRPFTERANDRTPYPVVYCRYPSDAMTQYGVITPPQARLEKPLANGVILTPLDLRLNGALLRREGRFLYIASHDSKVLQVRLNYQTGRDYFLQLADQASNCVAKLPSKLLNDLVPVELREYRDRLLTPGKTMRLKPGSDPDR